MVVLRGIRAVHVALAILALVCAALSVRVFAQEPGPRTLLSNAFTFQGRAAIDGIPVNDTCDFRFSLFDAMDGGTQSGPTIEKAAVPVESGLFTTQLDFGAGVFASDARFIAIELRCPAGSGTYAALPGRQELTATPYALYAQQVPYSGIVGGPPGFGEGWQNVIVVAKSGGQFTTIQAAIDSIVGASETNQFLVWVAPGIYEERISIPSWVTVRGAGENLSTITVLGGGTLQDSIAVSMAEQSALEELRVEIVGPAAETRAIQAQGVSAAGSEIRLHDVSAWCGAAGVCVGLYVATTALFAEGLEIEVSVPSPSVSFDDAFGIRASAATLRLVDYGIEVSRGGTGGETYGIYALNGSSYEAVQGTISVMSSFDAFGIVHLNGGEGRVSETTIVGQSSGSAVGISVIASTAYSVSESSISVTGQVNVTGIGLSSAALELFAVEIQPVSTAGTSTGIFLSSPIASEAAPMEFQQLTVGTSSARPTRSVYVLTGSNPAVRLLIEDSKLYASQSSVVMSSSSLVHIVLIRSSQADLSGTVNVICSFSWNSMGLSLSSSCNY